MSEEKHPHTIEWGTEPVSSLTHPDAPIFIKKIPPNCRDGFVHKMKQWVLKEQIERVRHYHENESLYNHQIGYLLCLSNLMDFLCDVQHTVDCSFTVPEVELFEPDRDF